MTSATQLAASDATPVMVLSDFFLGRVPRSETEMNRLLDAVAQHESTYAAAGLVDKELAGYEVLGRGFAKATPGPTLLDYKGDWFIVNTYANAFGYDATPAQVDHFLAQEAYFLSRYEAIGYTGNEAVTLARGVVIGQVLAWAVRTEGTSLNDASGHAVSAYLQNDGFEYGQNLYAYGNDTVSLAGVGLDAIV